MAPAAETVVGALILTGVTSYTAVALCHAAAMWNMRKKFFIALRSPYLACPSGAVLTLFNSFKTYVYVLDLHKQPPEGVPFYDGSISQPWVQVLVLFGGPGIFIAGCALIAWAIRLLVLYDPTKRKRWGHYTKESVIFRALVWSYTAIQGGAWSAVPFYGLQAVSYYTAVALDMFRVYITLVVVVLLGRPLKRMDDLCNLSRDGLFLGALMLFSSVANFFVWNVTWPLRVFKYLLIAVDMLSAQPIVYTINIKPVQDFLRDNQGERTLVSWVSAGFVGNNNHSVVACAEDRIKAETRLNSSVAQTPLAHVMGFLPLRMAFGEFCRKALCSESFQFLVDVSEFQFSVTAQDGKDDFEEFLAIIKKYIKNSSDSEINIDHHTKKEILKFSERSAYTSLSMQSRKGVFGPAEREIVKMLSDNLLSKFKATDVYKELAGELIFEAS